MGAAPNLTVEWFSSSPLFGGDEFCVLLMCDTLGEAAAAAERIRVHVASLAFAEAPLLKVTASIGVAVADADPAGAGLRALLAVADEALYEAKALGRTAPAPASRLGSRPLAGAGPPVAAPVA